MNKHSNGLSQAATGLVTLTALLVLGASPVGRASDEDFRYWSKATFLVPIAEQWEFGFEQKVGFDDEARRLGHHMQDYGLGYSHANGWLKLNGALKMVHAQTEDRDDWIHETRPHFNIAVLGQFRGVDFINRSRIEYRDIEDEHNVWRFRHKIRIDSPVTFTRLQVKPYVAEEIFYNFNADRFNGNRIQAGFFIPLHEKVRLDLFYFWHIHKEDDHDWSDANVIGTYIRFKL